MVTVAKLAHKSVREKAVSNSKFSFILPENLMGIELEVDSDSRSATVFPPNNLVYWNRIRDGSLVNGYEYVLKMPLAGNVLSDAIHEVFAPPTKVFRTMTGSTHIHMDMLEEEVTLDVLRTIVLLVYILEPMLYASGDASREWCGYSNSLKSAENTLLSALFSDGVEHTFSETFTRHSGIGRYYGLNLVALNDYGSLEFRYFPTASSPEELARWVNLVQCFKRAALGIGSPEELRNIVDSQEHYNQMLLDYFGEFEELHHHVADWYTVNSFFNKAEITANSALLERVQFSGKDVFTEGRFGELVTAPSSDDMNILEWLVQDGSVPNNAQEGTVLIYMNTVYVYLRHGWERIQLQIQPEYSDLHPATLEVLRRLRDDPDNYAPIMSGVREYLHIICGLGRMITFEDDVSELLERYVPGYNSSLDYDDEEDVEF